MTTTPPPAKPAPQPEADPDAEPHPKPKPVATAPASDDTPKDGDVAADGDGDVDGGDGGQQVQEEEQEKAHDNSELIALLQQKMSYDDLLTDEERKLPLTEQMKIRQQKLEKERKKQKREAMVMAVSDGLMSLSNLFFTTQYAPNMYNDDKSMSAKTQARHDKIKAEREKADKEWLDYAIQINQLKTADRDYQDKQDQLSFTNQLKINADNRAEARAEREAAINDAKLELYAGKIDMQEFQKRKAEADAKYAEAKAQWADPIFRSQRDRNNRSGRGGGGGGGKGGGGSQGDHYVYDSKGNVVGRFKSSSAAQNFAAENAGKGYHYNAPVRETSRTNHKGQTTTTRSQTTTAKKPKPY